MDLLEKLFGNPGQHTGDDRSHAAPCRARRPLAQRAGGFDAGDRSVRTVRGHANVQMLEGFCRIRAVDAGGRGPDVRQRCCVYPMHKPWTTRCAARLVIPFRIKLGSSRLDMGADVDRRGTRRQRERDRRIWWGDKAGRAGDPQSHVGSDAEIASSSCWAARDDEAMRAGVISREKVISIP